MRASLLAFSQYGGAISEVWESRERKIIELLQELRFPRQGVFVGSKAGFNLKITANCET